MSRGSGPRIPRRNEERALVLWAVKSMYSQALPELRPIALESVNQGRILPDFRLAIPLHSSIARE